MHDDTPLRLFEGFGVELEYVLVDRDTLDVRPAADAILKAAGGVPGASGDFEVDAEVERGPLAWSNELVLHVIELKTNGPAGSLEPLPALFQADVGRIHEILEPLGARLMPGGMHPWMDPAAETRLWPHEYNAVYRSYDRIFGCSGHGWSNLQSTHLNLPFADDDEFRRLHAAVRALLPLLPALAASSPVVEGRITGLKDARLEFYRLNQRTIPSLAGQVVPETVRSRADYEGDILARNYRDIAPFDPDGILRHEWLNSRGAIARFQRMALEIRVLDIQECPLADLAVCHLIVEILRALAEGRCASLEDQEALELESLAALFLAAVREGEGARVDHAPLLAVLGLDIGAGWTLSEVWRALAERFVPPSSPFFAPLDVILGRGTLSTRIVKALGSDPGRDRLKAVYRELCDCLRDGRMYAP